MLEDFIEQNFSDCELTQEDKKFIERTHAYKSFVLKKEWDNFKTLFIYEFRRLFGR